MNSTDEITRKAEEAGRDFAIRGGERAAKIREIAARELKRENIGVRRDGYQFVVEPLAVEAFVTAYTESKIPRPTLVPRLKTPTAPVDPIAAYEDAAGPQRLAAERAFERQQRLRKLAGAESHRMRELGDAPHLTDDRALSAVRSSPRLSTPPETDPIMRITPRQPALNTNFNGF